jgi:hypothetical protein
MPTIIGYMPKKKVAKKPRLTTEVNKLRRVFSQYIRIRDCNKRGYGKCCTCGQEVYWKKSDAGHFVKATYLPTRFDERNVHLQCRRCNRFGEGEQWKHGKHINEIYGEGFADHLVELGETGDKYTLFEVIQLRKVYEAKLALELKKRPSVKFP